jgi:hypothetical protein
MTSFNTYFDTIKTYQKTIQQTAAKTIDALDKKLERTQENLDKSVVIYFAFLFEIFYFRKIKVVAASKPEEKVRVWRRSSKDPLGEIFEVSPLPTSTSSFCLL